MKIPLCSSVSTVKQYICDAPARAMLKKIKYHSGCHSCEERMIPGEKVESRICFNDADHALRSEDGFKKGEYEGTHQKAGGRLHQLHQLFCTRFYAPCLPKHNQASA